MGEEYISPKKLLRLHNDVSIRDSLYRVTNDLKRRVMEHKEFKIDGFTKRYRINRLVYFAETPSRRTAIEREKEIKGWKREKKVKLIEGMNKGWKDLSEDWE